MMNYFSILGLMMFIFSLISFSTRIKHIISMLLSLEMMALGVFITLSSILLIKGTENFILIPFLTMVVCEGSLGLSLLVMMTRFFGNDFLKTSNLLKMN
uniref:NADH-ubiquinone oxidoreductase chain 4L n=1 Tax=Uroctonus mordax TaxID=507508 RepID=B2CKX9_9SCOR|nr:NADH dehydrogenase subunit 4L [Uroctonus mordax]ACA62678.1 NADH dehydrogenase subunit 4L [Uroctonus mordax]